MDIRADFGLRIKELRARSGMSQEMLAHRSGLDRSYIGGVERGERNVTLQNIERISAALNVSLGYLFSDERFSTQQAYLKKDFKIPFSNRFKYQIDHDKRILSFQVNGVLNGQEVEKLSSTLLGVCSAYTEGELRVFVDHRDMKATDGNPIVYSPEVSEKEIKFQEKLFTFSKQVIVLCNSQFMVNQLNQVTKESGIYEKSLHLFVKEKDMLGQAYEMLDIRDHNLIAAAK